MMSQEDFLEKTTCSSCNLSLLKINNRIKRAEKEADTERVGGNISFLVLGSLCNLSTCKTETYILFLHVKQ